MKNAPAQKKICPFSDICLPHFTWEHCSCSRNATFQNWSGQLARINGFCFIECCLQMSWMLTSLRNIKVFCVDSPITHVCKNTATKYQRHQMNQLALVDPLSVASEFKGKTIDCFHHAKLWDSGLWFHSV